MIRPMDRADLTTMQPLYIATQTFTPRKNPAAWSNFVAWSHLTQLTEVVSLDSILCPTLLPDIQDGYWPHIANEQFMLHFFVDLQFLMEQLPATAQFNLLCVFRNPNHPPPYTLPPGFEFLGFDLVDVQGDVSALTNCGGFPDVFDNGELSSKGLLTSYSRAIQVQSHLHDQHPEEHHADCDLWAIARSVVAGRPL